jgi:glycolate oxidase FAD binding subunit
MSMTATSVSSRLAGIVGSLNAIVDPGQLSSCSIGGKTPTLVVRPGSADEIAEVVKFAASEKLAIVPSGARTKLNMGMVPARYDLALDMTRLDRVIAYDPDDMTLGVEPGMPLSRLEGVLAGHKQFLPLAVPWMNRATVGGTIASGIDSPLRQFYGTARDYVLGIEFVTGNGQIAKSGGSVVKNVSGYDIHKLMIGAMGTLGVMTRINFRTFPALASTRVFVANVESAGRAIELRNPITQSPLRPLSMDIVSPRAADLFSEGAAARVASHHMPAGLFSETHWNVVVSFAGTEKVLERYERDLRQMVQQKTPSTLGAAVLDEGDAVGVIGCVREFIPIALESCEAATIVKMSTLPGRITQLLHEAERAARELDLPWAAIARGSGVIYLALLPTALDPGTRGRVAQVTERILTACHGLSGNASIPWCPSEWKPSLKVWGQSRGDFQQMRKVKSVFDPQGILSPGRFAGAF